jgi:ubiquinone/menaquinone biosynthesis C-methylase UbiE
MGYFAMSHELCYTGDYLVYFKRVGSRIERSYTNRGGCPPKRAKRQALLATYFGGEFQVFKKVIPGTDSRLTSVDHNETYGRHILDHLSKGLRVQVGVDLGCGNGDDLMIVKKNHPQARCIGIDIGDWNREKLVGRGIESVSINIESQLLPFENETIDLIIANQVLEHTKEIFFINHEVFRTLKVGGYLYLGVPNVLSLHNRILGLIGMHPTSAKMISAHVRVFSKRDTILFYAQVAGNFAFVEGFYGSQFYPFPKTWARRFAARLPSLAVSIFFLIRKTARYEGEFLDWLSRYRLETNFFTGGRGQE